MPQAAVSQYEPCEIEMVQDSFIAFHFFDAHHVINLVCPFTYNITQIIKSRVVPLYISIQ